MSSNAAIYSMTGFGDAIVEDARATAHIQIRCVNHRGRKFNVRSRPSLGAYEKRLRDRASAALLRGAIDITVNVSRKPDPDHLPVRSDLAASMVAAVRHLASELDLESNLTAQDLLHIPGLFDDGWEKPVTEAEWPILDQALDQALEQVKSMRLSEGQSTAANLLDLAKPIEDFVAMATEQAPRVVERARERLAARLEALGPSAASTANEQALEREVCFFADRSDIAEEMNRLTSHLSQFRNTLSQGGEIGKRLDFLSQEFLREINTTASKANDTEIVSRAVEAKLAVEKIKEQAANIE